MKRKGTIALWLMAIIILGLFTFATVIAPGPLKNLNSSSNNNGTADDSNQSDFVYNAPVVTSSVGTLKEGKPTNVALKASPISGLTNSGGNWAWVFSMDDVDDQAGKFVVGYDGATVQWYSTGSGSVTGLGSRFSQGPGAVAVDALANISISIGVPGSYTFKAWIVEAQNIVTLDPTGLPARSSVMTTDLTVEKKPDPVPAAISVHQTLTKPSEVIRGVSATFLLEDTAEAKGKWTGNITDKIIVEKSGIRRSDISGSYNGKPISWSSEGGYLIGSLGTHDAFKGEEDSESASWTTTVELTFYTTGTYSLRTEAINTKNSVDVSSGASLTVEVKRTSGSLNSTSESSGTSDNVSSPAAPAPVTEPVVTPTTAPTPPSPSGTPPTGNNTSGSAAPG